PPSPCRPGSAPPRSATLLDPEGADVDTSTASSDEVATLPESSGTPTLSSYVPRILLRHLATSPERTWWTTEGSRVFVDISGFTKLSEKLAKVGKEGA